MLANWPQPVDQTIGRLCKQTSYFPSLWSQNRWFSRLIAFFYFVFSFPDPPFFASFVASHTKLAPWLNMLMFLVFIIFRPEMNGETTLSFHVSGGGNLILFNFHSCPSRDGQGNNFPLLPPRFILCHVLPLLTFGREELFPRSFRGGK